MSKRSKLAPGQERSVSVLVKSLRNPPLEVALSSQPLNTSVLDVKTAVAKQARIPADKIKMLHKKKPVADSKVLKDLVGGDETTVEFSVMIMGGAAAIKAEDTGAAPEPSGRESGGERGLLDRPAGLLGPEGARRTAGGRTVQHVPAGVGGSAMKRRLREMPFKRPTNTCT